MSRRIAFSIVAAVALGVAGLCVAGVAFAAVGGQFPPDDSGPATPAAQQLPPPPTVPPTVATGIRPLLPSDKPVTESEVREFVESRLSRHVKPADVADSIAEDVIMIGCMADKGFYYDPRVDAALPDPASPAGLAMWGDTGAGDAYRWQDAGCRGLAVHKTGNDNNH